MVHDYSRDHLRVAESKRRADMMTTDSKKEPYRAIALRRGGAFEELTQKVLNLSEVARYLHVHRSTAYRMVQSGELPGFKIGSDWRFNLEEIDNWRLSRSHSLPPKEPVDAPVKLAKENGSRRA